MAKFLSVFCNHCGKPTRIEKSSSFSPCIWCKEIVEKGCRALPLSNKCEKCGIAIGDNSCDRCAGNGTALKLRTEGEFKTEFKKKSLLIGPYISWQQFNQDILDFSDSLKGKGYDAVIGVPRSGMVVASQMSIRLGVPLYSLNEYGPIYLGGGLRVRKRQNFGDPKNALLVEDSTASGYSIREAVKWMGDAMQEWKVNTAAVYTTDSQKANLSIYHRVINLPHWFEWNLIWNRFLMDQLNVGVDFDGILCPDFTTEQDDDGWRYLEAMKNAKCLVPAGTHIHAIITARLEKYRPWTQEWLKKHGITYNHLVMGNWQTKDERSTQCIGSYKAEKATQLDAKMFVESCPLQAKIIKSKSDVAVLCPALGGSIAR